MSCRSIRRIMKLLFLAENKLLEKANIENKYSKEILLNKNVGI